MTNTQEKFFFLFRLFIEIDFDFKLNNSPEPSLFFHETLKLRWCLKVGFFSCSLIFQQIMLYYNEYEVLGVGKNLRHRALLTNLCVHNLHGAIWNSKPAAKFKKLDASHDKRMTKLVNDACPSRYQVISKLCYSGSRVLIDFGSSSPAGDQRNDLWKRLELLFVPEKCLLRFYLWINW